MALQDCGVICKPLPHDPCDEFVILCQDLIIRGESVSVSVVLTTREEVVQNGRLLGQPDNRLARLGDFVTAESFLS